MIAEEEELEVSRIQTHRRGYPLIDQAAAPARNAGRARRHRRDGPVASCPTPASNVTVAGWRAAPNIA